MSRSRKFGPWSDRDAICLDCRTVLKAGEQCDGGSKHRVRSLSDRREREELLSEVWGPPTLRRRMKQLARAGGSGAAGGTFLESCTDCAGCDLLLVDGEIGAVVGSIALITAVFVFGYWLFSSLVGYIRRRRRRLKPVGATSKPADPGPATGAVGVVRARGPQRSSPISGRDCLAFATVFTCKQGLWREGVMLRDGETLGFDVLLDSGDTIRIPAGRVVLDGRGERVAPDAIGLESYLHKLDASRAEVADLDPFARDRIYERLLRDGDRVEVLSPVIAVASSANPVSSYREPAASYLAPRPGVTPVLRVERAHEG